MRFRSAVLFAVGLAIAPLGAQQGPPPGQAPPEAPQQPPVFRTGTNTVRVDVTVTDRSGAPLRGLTAEDFELFEDEVPQAITSFRLIESDGQPTDGYTLTIRNPEHAALEAAREDVRVFVIFWDEYHIGEFQSALRAREALKAFVLDSFGPTDLVAIMDPLTPLDALRFTRDRRELAEQIHRLKGRSGVYLPPRSVIEQAHLRERRNIEVLRSQVTASALQSLIMHLGAMREGRKSVVLMSETLGPISATSFLSELARAANHHNTALYAFDPRGLQISRPGAGTQLLRALAMQSGGDASQSNDLLPDLRKVVSRASAYYMLGYQPTDAAFDGRFRKIAVRVKQRGADVRARSGYWQPRASDLARAEAQAIAAAVPRPVSTALTQITPTNSHRPIELWAGFEAEGATRDVTVAWAPRSGFNGGEAPAWVSIEATVNGQTAFEGRMEGHSVSFPAAPGEVSIIATTHNAAGDVLDREQRLLVVPSADQEPLALSTPVVLRARTALEVKALDAGTATASATRDFSRTDRLRVRIAPFGAASRDAIVKAVLLGARGARLVDLPIRARGKYHEVDLPLTSVAQGEFLIRLEALSQEHKAEALVAFRVR